MIDNDNRIIIIREVQYTHNIPKSEPVKDEQLPSNTKWYIRKKKKAEPVEDFRITKLVIEGYNPNGKFIGTFNDDYCELLIKRQNDKYNVFDIYKLRTRWENIVMQKDAFLAHEADLEKKAREERLKYCNCDKRDMPTYKEDGKTWCPQCGLEVK